MKMEIADSRGRLSRSVFRTATAVVIGWTGTVAQAQSNQADATADAAQPGEIVVTAQRFAEPLSKAPITISALSGDALSARNLQSLADIGGAVPGLQVNSYFGQARTNIRGIGQNSLSVSTDSQVAYSLNGVYVGQAFSAAQAFLDLERIEVLRGPQGTLYGRNATGGAINLISARPTKELFGYGEVSYGNYDAVQTRGVISGPITDKILARVAFATEDRDGYALNLFDGKRYNDSKWQTVRGTLQFNPGEDLSLMLVGDYYHQNDGSLSTHLFGTSPGYPVITGTVLGGQTVPLDANGQAIDPRLLNIDTLPAFRNESGGVSADLNWTVNDSLTFKSLTAYRASKTSFTVDFDSTEVAFESERPGANFYYATKSKQVSQEFQILGDHGSLKWVAGLYYFHQKVGPGGFQLGLNFGTPAAPFLGVLAIQGTTKTDAYAGFGQATLSLTDRLSATAGLRYSHERRSAFQRQTVATFGDVVEDADRTSFNDFSPKFTLDFQATNQLLLYATISKGFQSGGFDINNQPPLRAFQPERIWNYEAGLKYRSRLLSLDMAAFHYDYSDLQVAQIVNGLPSTSNAASSTVNGAEVETTLRPVRGLSFTGAFAFLDTEFTQFSQLNQLTGLNEDLAGNRLPGSSRYSSNIAAAYDIDLGDYRLSLNGDWNWRSRIFFSEFNSRQVSQPGVHTFNAAARFGPSDSRWYGELFGRNLTNRDVAVTKYITGAGFGSMVLGQLAPPRTYGVRVHYQFGR